MTKMTNKCHTCGTKSDHLSLAAIMGGEVAMLCPACFENETGIKNEKRKLEQDFCTDDRLGIAGAGHHQNDRKNH